MSYENVKAMKTKFVYVLVSSSEDCYYEQTLCSVYSLKLHNPQAGVYLVVDELTASNLTGKRAAICDYIKEIIKIKVPDEFNQMQRSRYLKTNLRKFIDGDMLFVDSDTLIVSSLEEVDHFDFEIGAVADAHVNIKDYKSKDKIYKWAKIGDWDVDENKPYLNSGVIYVKDSVITRDFYEKWYHYWYKNYKKGLYKDQSSLAKTNVIMGYLIKEMSGFWNCQFIEGGLKYLSGAKIIHYYSSRGNLPYYFSRKDFYHDLKDSGKLPEQLKKYIENPFTAFSSDSSIVAGNDEYILKKYFFRVCADKYPKLYHFLTNIPRPIKKGIKFLCRN